MQSGSVSSSNRASSTHSLALFTRRLRTARTTRGDEFFESHYLYRYIITDPFAPSESHLQFRQQSPLAIKVLTPEPYHPSSIWSGIRIANERFPKILSKSQHATRYGVYYDGFLPSLHSEDHRRKTLCLKYRTSTARMGPKVLVGCGCLIYSFARRLLLGFALQSHRRSGSNGPRSRAGGLH